MSSSTTYTIIIPTLNRPSYIKLCLESISRQSIPATECIVVDQSDSEETRNIFEAFDLGTTKKVYFHQKEKSLMKARNRGLDLAGDVEFIGFLDDDVEVLPDYYQQILKHFTSDEKKVYAAGMGTMVDAPTNIKEDRFLRFFRLPRMGDGHFESNGLPTFPHWKQEFSEVSFLSGGMSLFRAPLIKSYRYDERIKGYGYGDDVDVTYRLSRKYKLFIEPKAKLKHDTEAHGRDQGRVMRSKQLQSYYYLLQKNVGLNWRSAMVFGWSVLGQVLDDLRHLRRSALIGDMQAIIKILSDKIDSVEGYGEFKKQQR